MTNDIDNTNDYAVARELNLLVMGMIMNIYLANNAGISVNNAIQEINRPYILLVDELQKLYDNNPKLSALEPEPIWKHFDVLKSFTGEINKHIANPDNDYGNAHYARVEKLCIVANAEIAHFTNEQKDLVDNAEKLVDKYFDNVQEAYVQNRVNKENDWQIPLYTLSYKLDGTILINDVFKLKKAHAGSTTERLLEQALKHPYTLFKPELGQTSRNLSTVLNSAGFTEEIRKLFFPTVSKSKGIVFRPTITREQADADKIDTTELDLKLKALGASTEPKKT